MRFRLASIAELSVFLYHVIDLTKNEGMKVTSSGPSPLCSWLIYDPYRRYEIWRLLSYIFVHSGYVHISTNIVVQLLLGFPLEIVHGPLRIGTIYMTGALTGALMTSMTDPGVFLSGASGGVYALLLAHLPTVIMNWREMKTFFEWFVSVLILSIGLVDFAIAIYHRYLNPDTEAGSIGYAAHIGGGAAGFLIGMNVLRNFNNQTWEGYLRMVCWLIWVCGIIAAIMTNAIAKDLYPITLWTRLDECMYYNPNVAIIKRG